MSINVNSETWKTWERSGKTEFLKQCKATIKDNARTPLLSKSGKLTGLGRAIYELFSNGIKGTIRRDAVSSAVGELCHLHNDLPSIILDVLNILDAETALSDPEERQIFCQITKDTEKFLSDKLLKERLEIDTLNEAGILSTSRTFYTKFIKIKTKLYYKQRKFNLYREESEGYAKLIVELNQEINDTITPKNILEVIKSLIGCFNLDPNRVLDVILESFECRPDQGNFFIPLIRSYMPDKKIICEVLGFKFNIDPYNTPKSLYKVTALMLQHSVINLDDIYYWLSPDDKILCRQFEREMSDAKEYVRRLNIISINKDKDKETDSNEQDKDNINDRYECNQKFNLCQALIEIGDWNNAHQLCLKLPENYVIDQQPIAVALCKLIHYLIDQVYRSKCRIAKKINLKPVQHTMTNLGPKQAQTLLELKTDAIPMIVFLGPSLHYDPVLASKILRICESALAEMDVNSLKLPKDNNNLYYEIFSILDSAILPALSFMDCNCCIAEEIWNIIKLYPYQYRYSLYGRWKNDTFQQYAKLLRRKGETQKEIKHLVKRISKENIKPIGRSIGKLTHCSPGFFFDYVLLQIQIYDNLIIPIVDSLKYLTSLSYDILGYCLIEALSSPDKQRMKHDGTSISLWLKSLASFCGAVFKKYNIELCGLLQYVANQLKAQKSTDLLILKEVVLKMACIDAAEELTEEQLEALAGGELLKGEAASFSQVRNTKKSSLRLKEALNEHDLSVALCLLIAQQKYCVIYRETEYTHLKLVSKLYDQCQDTLVQFGSFLGSTYSVDEYVTRLPSIQMMLQEYHIHTDVAFFLARPMFTHAISQKYDQLRKTDPNPRKLTAALKQAKYAEACEHVMSPVVASVRTLHPARVWEDMSPQFLVTFWSLSMADLHVPVESYNREINRLKQLSLELLDQQDSANKNKKEQERHMALIEKLQDERKKQQEHVDKVMYRLKQEKDTWFVSRSSKSAKNETITQFLQLCLFPRCIFTAIDAVFCAKFVHIIHSLKTVNFSTLLCYDRIFCDITYSVTLCTENEAHRYGRFLAAMLATVTRWHSDRSNFEKECADYPGFMTKFRVSNQFSEANDHVGYENYRHVCHKWHYKLTKSMVMCLDSKDYVQIRNALIILVKILPYYPILSKLAQIVERKIEKVKEDEKDKRQDLYAMALSYGGQLKARSSQMIRESEFHQVSKSNDASSINSGESKHNGDISKNDKEKSKDPGRDRERKNRSGQTDSNKNSDRDKRDNLKENTPAEKEKSLKKEKDDSRTTKVDNENRDRDRSERDKRKERKEEKMKEEQRQYKEDRYNDPLSPSYAPLSPSYAPLSPSNAHRYGSAGSIGVSSWSTGSQEAGITSAARDDRELSSVSSNGSNLHRRSQEPPEPDRDVKRRKLDASSKNHSGGAGKQSAGANLDTDIKSTTEGRKEHRAKNKDKDKFNMAVIGDDDLKLRKERKLGRKRDRLEEAILLTEKRRKDEEKGKLHQNGDPDEIHHRDKHHHSREKSPYLQKRDRGHDKPYSSKKQYYDYNERYYD